MAGINTGTSTTILGYFATHEAAETAIEDLKDAGFAAHEVGLAARSSALSSTTTSSSSSNEGPDFWSKVRNFFEGNTPEPYAEEKTRGDLATREITTGSGYGEYGSEDLYGSLSGLSVPSSQSSYFGQKLRTGGALVTVSAGSRRDEAIEILEENGADLGENALDLSTSDRPVSTYEKDSALDTERNIQLYGEVLRVHKDRISAGEVRLRKEVHTEVQTVQVPVTREELVLERVQVDGTKAAPDATFGKESEIRIPLTEERAYVEKQPIVVEEVRVGKREVGSVESFDEQVRHEELKVEDQSKTRAS